MGKKRGKATRKARRGQIENQEQEYAEVPHTLVFQRGQTGKNVQDLISDMRKVMRPYTAPKLRVTKKNVLKDFVSIAGPLSITHFIVFTKTQKAINMRFMRLPRGPTITFRVQSYSLGRDVVSSIKRPNVEPKQFLHHPLLVMNGFSGDGLHIKLMATMFQNLFPSINVNKVNLKSIRRCVLLNYNKEQDVIEFRHYNVRAVPVGMSRGVKKLMKSKVPNLARFEDVSEYLTRGGDLSESEAELDGPHNEVILPQTLGCRGNIKSSKSAIRLTELGPRLTLQLVKIQEGVAEGEVLFHKFIEKTEEEMQAAAERRTKKQKLKQERKMQQTENIKRKEQEKERHKKQTLAGMKGTKNQDEDLEDDRGDEEVSDEDDDREYYRQEVGEEPDADLFPSSNSKSKRVGTKRSSSSSGAPLPPKRFRKEQRESGKEQKKFSDHPKGQNARTSWKSNEQDYQKKKRWNKDSSEMFKKKKMGMKKPGGKGKKGRSGMKRH